MPRCLALTTDGVSGCNRRRSTGRDADIGPPSIAVALRQPVGTPLAVGRAGQCPDLHLHKPIRDEADHLARYSAMKSVLRTRFAPLELHHQPGHDPRNRLAATSRGAEASTRGAFLPHFMVATT